MDFEKHFREWLVACLAEPSASAAHAFAFNLYEPAGNPNVKFGVELIGTASFDAEDPDWACDEVWEPELRGIPIPVAYSGEDWEGCLENVKTLLVKILDGPDAAADKLKAVEAVAIGFVDGDLDVVWTP
ncbi:hypothetical protein [Bremerella sp.]|uniref:hypothetical protein n=1 Tax=Bremerella sp. TaxID=2795602 RepID=UPI00391D32E6